MCGDKRFPHDFCGYGDDGLDERPDDMPQSPERDSGAGNGMAARTGELRARGGWGVLNCGARTATTAALHGRGARRFWAWLSTKQAAEGAAFHARAEIAELRGGGVKSGT